MGAVPSDKPCAICLVHESIMRSHHTIPQSRGGKVAATWLDLVSKRYRIRIQTANSDLGEKQFNVNGVLYRADGFSNRHGIIFEVYGDLWHGSKEYGARKRSSNPFSSLSDRELYEKTMKREAVLSSIGYTVISIWQHEFNSDILLKSWLKKTDRAMKRLVTK